MTLIIWKIFLHWVKNIDSILENNMAELIQKKKNSKQAMDKMQCENFISPWKWINSTVNKTFYTCYAESLFLRYKKIFKKAVKLGNFLQSSVHIFLGHDGCVWKINLRILFNHIMKNFQVKHGQCDSIIFPPKHFLLDALSNNQTVGLLTAGFFTFGMSWDLSTSLS